MLHIDRDAALRQFDSLVNEGELYFKPTTQIVVQDQGLRLDFRVVDSYKSKPQLSPADDPKGEYAASKRRPPPADGSDIDHSDPAFFVADVNPEDGGQSARFTHKLILNKFCAFRPQYILLTHDPLRRQHEPLDLQDFQAAWKLLHGLHENHYLIFNGGQLAGSSRVHKHMQVLEKPQDFDANIAPKPSLPYLYFLHTMSAQEQDVTDQTTQKLHQTYQHHISESQGALQACGSEMLDVVPHNFIMTRNWMLTIPRSKATVPGLEGHIVNAAGMIGQLWLNNDLQLAAWKRLGPSRVLQQLGLSRKGSHAGDVDA